MIYVSLALSRRTSSTTSTGQYKSTPAHTPTPEHNTMLSISLTLPLDLAHTHTTVADPGIQVGGFVAAAKWVWSRGVVTSPRKARKL